jgi:preprotein translocase subunit SecG
MSLLIGFLTFIMVVNCLFLMLLILIQLPKKEAGAGIAFGGAATDALFGAGSGNALTQATKYSASLFVGIAIILSMMNMHAAKQGSRRLEQELNKQASTPIPIAPALPGSNALGQSAPLAVPAPAPAATAPATGNLLTPTLTNAPAPANRATPQAEAPTAAPAKVPAAPAAPAKVPAAPATSAEVPAGPIAPANTPAQPAK